MLTKLTVGIIYNIDVLNIVILHTLNLHSNVCQHLDNIGRKKKLPSMCKREKKKKGSSHLSFLPLPAPPCPCLIGLHSVWIINVPE